MPVKLSMIPQNIHDKQLSSHMSGRQLNDSPAQVAGATVLMTSSSQLRCWEPLHSHKTYHTSYGA